MVSWDFMGWIPSGDVKIANWKMTIEIVDIANKHGDFPVRDVNLPEGNGDGKNDDDTLTIDYWIVIEDKDDH